MATYPYSLTITNPGAESGDMTGWTNEVGTFFAQGSGSPKTGSYLFQGPAAQRGSCYQDITLDTEVLTDVDADDLQVEIGCWIDTYTTPDYRQIAVEFLDTSDAHMGIVHLEWLLTDEGDWTYHSIRSLVPSGTRKIRIWMIAYRNAGTNNDFYGDDWEAQLIDASSAVTFPTYVPILNPSADEGDTSGWTDVTGTMIVQTGTYYSRTGGFNWNDIAAAQAYNEVTISCPALLTKIATGSVKATATVFHREPTSTDNLKLTLETYDSAPSLLDSANTGANQRVPWTYDPVSITPIDPDTEKFRFTLDAVRTSAPLNVCVDDLSLLLEDLSISVEVSLDAAIAAELSKTVSLDAAISNEMVRVTQLGKGLLWNTTGQPIRVTQLGKQMLWLPELPERPSILTATSSDGYSADITSSAFYSPEGESHAGTRYQIQAYGGDWSSILWDSGVLGAVELVSTPNVLSELSVYGVRVAYQDAEGDWSEWSLEFGFGTPAAGGGDYAGDYDQTEWANLWNIGSARYYSSYTGPGGWHEINWDFFKGLQTHPVGDLEGFCSGSFWYADARYNGEVGQFGRLMGPPAAHVYKPAGASNGVDVSALLSFYSSQEGFSWQRYYDCELAEAGVVAAACGTVSPLNPEYTWNAWRGQLQLHEWEFSDEYQGVFAYIKPLFAWPFWYCGAYSGNLGHACSGICSWSNRGYASAQLCVEVWFNGKGKLLKIVNLPWQVTFSQKFPWCSTGGLHGWICRMFPFYGIRLRVEHDYATDPTGKTHTIKVNVSTPTTQAYGVVDGAGIRAGADPSDVTADLPDDTWMIEETWVGGHEESTPGAGDGGLRVGWSGYGSRRPTGAVSNRLSGITVFKNLTVLELDDSWASTPCDAVVPDPPTPPPEEPDPPVTANPSPGVLSPCPPAVDSAASELFLGGSSYYDDYPVVYGEVLQFGGYEVQAGSQIVARIRPNPIAPMGFGGEALFHRLVVVAEHFSDLQIAVTPILNGERLDQYSQEEVFFGSGEEWNMRRFEVPLYRAFEDAVVEGAAQDRFKYGLRGTYLTFEMIITDLCGIGLQLPGVWVEWEPVRESHNTGIIYTEDLQVSPITIPSGQVFMGTKGANRLLKAGSGTTDDGETVQARAFSNPVSPEGEAGECEFRRISLTVTRWNGSDMDLVVTPYVDGQPMAPVTINYKATTAPVKEVTEVDLGEYYSRAGGDAIERFRYRRRGAWAHLQVDTGSGLQEWLTLEGGEIEFDVVREGLQKDVRNG